MSEYKHNLMSALQEIEAAQNALYHAARFLSPVPGMADVHGAACKLGDAAKALWHEIEEHPRSGDILRGHRP